MQQERYMKFGHSNALSANDEGMDNTFGKGKYCSYCFEDDTSFPLRILPIIMFVKGVTIRILLRTDGWNCVPKKALGSTADFDDAVAITTVES